MINKSDLQKLEEDFRVLLSKTEVSTVMSDILFEVGKEHGISDKILESIDFTITLTSYIEGQADVSTT